MLNFLKLLLTEDKKTITIKGWFENTDELKKDIFNYTGNVPEISVINEKQMFNNGYEYTFSLKCTEKEYKKLKRNLSLIIIK